MFTQRIVVRPEAPGEGFIHDHDLGRLGVVRGSEIAAGAEWNVQGLEP